MKRCGYCGEKYPDEYSICSIDENPLESCDPGPSTPQTASTSQRHSAMAPHTIAALISGACVISSIAVFFFLGLAPNISGGFRVLAILGVLVGVKVILFTAAIAFIVQGFRVHWGWGLANLIGGPLAGIVFLSSIGKREECRSMF
jgi:hypothetical protein